MNTFLFSVDLEDIRLRMSDGCRYKERVPAMVEKYLSFFNRHKFKTTFFTLGDIAEKYPSLIKTIVEEGHEIACHSYNHLPIEKFSPEQFKDDLKKNLDALYDAGAKEISGFRAPVASLTEKTQWAYSVLAELGFNYSSSVIPAKNPLYEWNDFGTETKIIENVIEIPISVHSFFGKKIPFASGIYFRMLPLCMIRSAFTNHFKNNKPVLGYFHPYDIDTEQERFMHPGINENKIYNFLMYYHRSTVFEKLEKLLSLNFSVMPYDKYVKQLSVP